MGERKAPAGAQMCQGELVWMPYGPNGVAMARHGLKLAQNGATAYINPSDTFPIHLKMDILNFVIPKGIAESGNLQISKYFL